MADKRIIDLGDRSVAADDYLEIDGLTNGSARLPVGRAGGPPILDSAGKITDRLAYEGAAGGVATLDAEGKLAQPRRVLDVQFAVGTTNSPSYAADVGAYIMADPRVTVTVEDGDAVILNGFVVAYQDTAGEYIVTRLYRSSDGGSTWVSLGKISDVRAVAASYAVTLPLAVVDYPGAGTHIYGISLGRLAGDSGTVTAQSTNRVLSAMVVDY